MFHRLCAGIVAGVVAIGLLSGAAAADTPDTTVQSGDTLWELTGGDWRYACIVNVAAGRIPDCDLIQPGQQVRVLVPAEERARIDAWFSAVPRPVRVSAAPTPAMPRPRASAPRSSGGPSSGWAIPWSIVACESGGDYGAENPTSSASGAYQITDGTWGGYGGYSHASDAPPSVQDERAAQIWDGGAGRSNWVC